MTEPLADHYTVNKVCEICDGRVEPTFDEYQSFAGRVWRGHKDCTAPEAAKWVLVQRDDLRAVLEDADHGGAYHNADSSYMGRLYEALEA